MEQKELDVKYLRGELEGTSFQKDQVDTLIHLIEYAIENFVATKGEVKKMGTTLQNELNEPQSELSNKTVSESDHPEEELSTQSEEMGSLDLAKLAETTSETRTVLRKEMKEMDDRIEEKFREVMTELKGDIQATNDKIDEFVIEIRTEISDLRKELHEFKIEVFTRFEQINTRFEQMNIRFEQMNTRFEQMNASFTRKMIATVVLVATFFEAVEYLTR